MENLIFDLHSNLRESSHYHQADEMLSYWVTAIVVDTYYRIEEGMLADASQAELDV